MLTKRQLEDAAKCPQNGLCTKCEMDCVRTLYNGYFDGCISEVAQTALAYRVMLERLEWSGLSGYSTDKPIWYCVVCGRRKEKGHAADCELAKLLKGSEVEESEVRTRSGKEWVNEVEVVRFTPEEIDEAIEGLDGLQQIIVPILRKSNVDGMAEQDIQQFKKHIMMAKHALIAMGKFLECEV